MGAKMTARAWDRYLRGAAAGEARREVLLRRQHVDVAASLPDPPFHPVAGQGLAIGIQPCMGRPVMQETWVMQGVNDDQKQARTRYRLRL
jgi:hypothetical protein